MSAKKGGSLTRSEIVTVRLDPKTRYLAELAARVQRRTLSSFVEWAIAQAVEAQPVNGRTLGQVADDLWDTDEADRFVMLAMNHPTLLNHDEQVLWKVIRECSELWTERGRPMLKEIREKWPMLQEVARGERPAADLSDVPF
jgi:hypothetical protein